MLRCGGPLLSGRDGGKRNACGTEGAFFRGRRIC
jgi:hypothetical protein